MKGRIKNWILGFFLFLGCMITTYPEQIPLFPGGWDAEQYGNHRIVIHVEKAAEAVWAHIPWRRRDRDPDRKELIVVDAFTGKRLKNVFRARIMREFGDIVFQPETVPGDYYVYTMPYRMSGRNNYPTVTYPEPRDRMDRDWLKRTGLDTPEPEWSHLPQALIKGMQSVDDFNSFYPMELIATQEETRTVIDAHPGEDYILFPEDRKFPIRMTDDLPYRWITRGEVHVIKGQACRGEFYAFQIGFFAARRSIDDVKVSFGDLVSAESGVIIPSSAFQSINTEGVNWDGEPFDKIVSVPKGKVQAFWCGVQIPKGVPPGIYKSMITVSPRNSSSSQLAVEISVSPRILEDSGDAEPWRHSRLRWLNSTIAMDDDIVPPFTPLRLNGNTLSCLGRKLVINNDGFPRNIQSFFNPEVTGLQETARNILAGPMKFIVETAGGRLEWETESVRITKQSPGTITWKTANRAGGIRMTLTGQMEFDGFVAYRIKLETTSPVRIKDIRLEIPLVKDVAQYMLGMGRKGGRRIPTFRWKWNQTKNHDAVWLGDVNAGLCASFRAENYSRPLNTNFYLSKPLNMPPSWFNSGRGGCTISETHPYAVTINMFSGERDWEPGESLHYDFNLLITPFKPLDTGAQWSTRFFHAFRPIDEIAATGANTINNHHANDVNPTINYPFIHTEEMKAYVDEAHAKGLKVKIYYTIRELSNHAPELFALRSLGHEIFSPGKGGGFSWLQEHLGSDYIAAWFVPRLKDAAIINSGMSRWHNYYLEGLDWLVKNIGIDGLYIDDVAFDRTTMKRIRKILDRNRKGALIDLHSANQFNPRDGYINSALLYMEHFPYINRLWFGEYFDYGSEPAFWLTEVSGIPFGLMGEMLQDGGNPWRGMVYGMTSRLPWAGNPKPLWAVWDDFGIQDSRMYGYWSSRCPVKTSDPRILATAYVKKDRTLIALASWADESVDVHLSYDWKSLGIDPDRAKIAAPVVKDFQREAAFTPKDGIPVEPGKGWLLIIDNGS